MANPFNLLRKLFQKPASVPVASILKTEDTVALSDKDRLLLKTIGVTRDDLSGQLQEDLQINYERRSLYQEFDKARDHWMVGAALGAFADFVTTPNALQNCTAWITSESSKYVNELTKMFDRIGVEERIYDWAWTTGCYGDHFPKVNGQPGLGVVSIEDGFHPVDISRLDYEGVLIGFYLTPQGGLGSSGDGQTLLSPWDYVHFRMLGAKKKRCLAGSTRIRLLDNTSPTIKEMSENSEKYVGRSILSINPETRKIEYDVITAVQMTIKDAQLVRVHLDNSETIDCTPDHRFMLRDGSYKEAQFLEPDESLMPFYLQKVLNHKVVKIEWLENCEDTYDLTVEKNHNFPLEAGVFVHNSIYGDPNFMEYRTIHLMAPDTRQRMPQFGMYGTSLILDALPVWKRLRLAEDSILMSRLTRGITKYLYKVRVDSGNIESVSELMDQYVTILKRARAIDTGSISGTPAFDSKWNAMS
ncbi:MAG: Hint domain-containing protein, partial [Candidatus Heimdallarchaeaceae archaeon]